VPVRYRAEDQQYAARRWTRRGLLRAGAAGAAGAAAAYASAGCGLWDRQPDPQPSTDPLDAVRLDALRLATLCDAAVVAYPDLASRLNPIREAHIAHATELARVIGAPTANPASASPTSVPVGGAIAALAAVRAAEQEAQRTATRLCLTAPASRAALVGSIVAALATHQEVLR
jgi:hypothetical protein